MEAAAAALQAMPQRKDGCVVDWGAGLMAAWQPSEGGALSALEDFLEIGGTPQNSCSQLPKFL